MDGTSLTQLGFELCGAIGLGSSHHPPSSSLLFAGLCLDPVLSKLKFRPVHFLLGVRPGHLCDLDHEVRDWAVSVVLEGRGKLGFDD